MSMTGTVEHVRYTSGGAGNQWTTIDGVRDAPWWDSRSIDGRVGDRVTFTTSQHSLWSGPPAIAGAQNSQKECGPGRQRL